jgi:hypothetical protein
MPIRDAISTRSSCTIFPRSGRKEDQDLIGAEIIAYCKWLIYTAPFKDIDIESRIQINQDFYNNERATIRKSEETFCRRLKEQLKIWYEKHPPSKRQKATQRNPDEDSDKAAE